MKKLFIVLLFLTLSEFTYQKLEAQVKIIPVLSEASASIKKDVNLKSSFDTTVQWLENEDNQKEMHKKMGIEVLENLGNGKLKVKKETSKGNFIWIMQEKIEKKNNLYKYKSSLVESIEGKMNYSNTEIIVTTKKDRTNILIKVSAGINNPDISNFEIYFDLNMHTAKLKKLLESQLK